MLFMRDSKHKGLLALIFGLLVMVGIIVLYWWQRGDALLVQPPSDQNTLAERATAALKEVVDAANEISGITSGAVFSHEIQSLSGHSANFGITKYDGVRGEEIAKEDFVTFREIGSSNNISEVDKATNYVVAMRREAREFGNPLPADMLEKRTREFVAQVYPEFKQVEGTFEYDPNSKTSPRGSNYFFRWNDTRLAMPDGIEMDLPPYIQIGINQSGFIFSYDNTVQLYNNPPKETLRTICGYVEEMPKIDDSSLDRGTGVVRVWFTEYEPFQNRFLILPYEPETDFAGCSESAKTYLRHLPNDPTKQ